MIDEVENILKESIRSNGCDNKLQDKLLSALDDLVKKIIRDIKKPFLYYNKNAIKDNC